MKRKDLKIGLIVKWNDPDDGLCSVQGKVINYIHGGSGTVWLRLQPDGKGKEWASNVWLKELELICPIVSKSPNKNWKNDSIQFARLIAEAESCGLFEGQRLTDLADSMSLSEEEVCEMIDRAQTMWDLIKTKI